MNSLSRVAVSLLMGLSFVQTAPQPCRAQNTAQQWAAQRRQMVRKYVYDEGVTDPRVLEALLKTPRHLFVPNSQRKYAYLDMALPIGSGQTISSPYIVGFMTAHLKPKKTDRVLEIGTGSGYQAAVLSELVDQVYSIEIVLELGRQAEATLRRLKYTNVHTKVGDGFLGWPKHAPFDKIIVTCSPEKVPIPLVQQLKEGGRIVIPLGKRFQQSLCLLTKVNGRLKREKLQGTFFVPMTGAAERLRQIRSGSAAPQLLNAGFEKLDENKEPDGWYYVRQASVEKDADAPQGQSVLTCRNDTPGRDSNALQAAGVDGRRVRQLQISAWVRTRDVAGRSVKNLPRLEINFFDENRQPVGEGGLGPWHGDTPWEQVRYRVSVPRQARLLVLAVGMYGATGEISFDDIRIQAIPSSGGLSRKPSKR